VTTDELVEEIFGRCRERMDRGESVDVEAIVRAHPDLERPLRARFEAARLVDLASARGRARRSDGATRVGAALGPYRIEAVLGSGGMGTVYLASAAGDAASRVALKVFHPHLAGRERFATRFEREAALGKRVDHPNVVRTLDAGETREADQTLRFLVMEHVEGRTLRALLDEMGCRETGREEGLVRPVSHGLPEELVRHVGREVAKGLAAIHAAGAVHRDLKPENVIVTKDHFVKVMDLGVAHLEDAATLSETGAFIGSLRYGAPEQVGRGGGVDGRADLHALGLLLHELATGAHAFAGEEFGELVRQILDVRPRRIGELAPQVSPFLEELVGALLEKDREKRPASAAAVAAILADGEASPWWRQRAAGIRRETRRPLRRVRLPRETEIYGRESEISRLCGLYEKAKSGDGQVVLVEGEAGIGKSRLVDEFVLSLWAAGEDIDFLFGSYPPGGAASASGAFATAYREHLGDDDDAVRAALPRTPLLVPAFAALLRGDAAPEGSEKLTKDSLQTVFVHATRSFAARRTTIVLIDDLHFAPQEGRALFASLALATPGHRILLVGGARPSLDEKWSAALAQSPGVSRLPLERLSPKELVALLKEALRSEHLATELAGKIADKSDGNPFFVFEILRGLREGRFLKRRPDGTWVTTREIRDIEIPPSIVEVIQARVLDLDTEERNALEVASCAGFEFDAALVGAVLRVEPIPLLQRLGTIEKAHRLVRSVGQRFAFDHHQVQEVLYAGLSPPLREAYHAAIADALETRSGAASKDPSQLDGALSVDLAQHFLAGAQGPRALRHLDAALTHLEKGWLNDAAARLAERALAAPGLLTGSARVATLLRLAARLDLLGRRGPQRAAIEEALALARAAGDRHGEVRALRGLGATCIPVGLLAEAWEHYGRASAIAREIGDRHAELSAQANMGLILQYQDRLVEAKEQLERCVPLAREIGDAGSEAVAAGNLGIVLFMLGRFAEAREHQERYVERARELGDRRNEGVVTGSLGNLFQSLGRLDEAREHHERQLAIAREIGDRRGEAFATNSLGGVFHAMSRYAEAREHIERGLALMREIGDRTNVANTTGDLGILLRALGRLPEAREHLERWLTMAREIGDRRQECYALSASAELLGDSGEIELAERLFADALDIERTLGIREAEAEFRCARGELFARAGRADAAREDLEAALALAREIPLPRIELASLAHLATLPGGDAGPVLAALAAHGDRAELQTRMHACLVLWRTTHDRAHLDEARRLLDFTLDNSPPDCRETMLANVRLHRDVAAAWREETERDGGPRAE
jgi:serine/threonine protein kinase/tetratricopeptide (TPR) repeat protein